MRSQGGELKEQKRSQLKIGGPGCCADSNAQGLGSTLPKTIFRNASSSGPEEAEYLLGEENLS